MKIVEFSAKILWPELLTTALDRLEYIGRISHRTEDLASPETAEQFIRKWVAGAGHWSIAEHVSVSVEFTVDRGISHEMVRHRLPSYLQESTRYVNYEKKMPAAFIYPIDDVSCPYCLAGEEPHFTWLDYKQSWVHRIVKQNAVEVAGRLYTATETVPCVYDYDWLTGRDQNEAEYKKHIAKGWAPEDARSALPTCTATKIVTTANLRCWRHIFCERVSRAAHHSYRKVSIPTLLEFQKLFPGLYDDITPNAPAAELKRLMQ